MRSSYYDIPAREELSPPPEWGLETLPGPEAPPPPPKRTGARGAVIFSLAALLIAAGIIALAALNGLNPAPELPHRPADPGFGFDFGFGDDYDHGFDFGFGDDFDFPSLEEETPETTIERYPAGEDLGLVLEEVPGGGELTYQAVYEKVLPSIVGIRAYGGGGLATGTGVVLREDGYIITNFHVIEGAEAAETVMQDGTVYEALLVGGDRTNDLAVLKIDAEGLFPAAFGDSDLLRVGDEAFAIGNPLGEELMGTMTNGIISAINRDVNIDGVTMTLLQTTAALNSGNSGGALVNIYGQVVGITNMKMTSGGYYGVATVEGLGFAIPSATVRSVAGELAAKGRLEGRPVLGVTVRPLLEEEWESWDLPTDFDGGLLVVEVQKASDAYRRGVEPGDIIVKANGVPTRTNEDLLRVKEKLGVGDRIRLELWRDGSYTVVNMRLVDQYELDNVKE